MGPRGRTVYPLQNHGRTQSDSVPSLLRSRTNDRLLFLLYHLFNCPRPPQSNPKPLTPNSEHENKQKEGKGGVKNGARWSLKCCHWRSNGNKDRDQLKDQSCGRGLRGPHVASYQHSYNGEQAQDGEINNPQRHPTPGTHPLQQLAPRMHHQVNCRYYKNAYWSYTAHDKRRERISTKPQNLHPMKNNDSGISTCPVGVWSQRICPGFPRPWPTQNRQPHPASCPTTRPVRKIKESNGIVGRG